MRQKLGRGMSVLLQLSLAKVLSGELDQCDLHGVTLANAAAYAW